MQSGHTGSLEPSCNVDTVPYAQERPFLDLSAITKGCNPPVNDQFCPNSNVTRGQMAAFLHRALG